MCRPRAWLLILAATGAFACSNPSAPQDLSSGTPTPSPQPPAAPAPEFTLTVIAGDGQVVEAGAMVAQPLVIRSATTEGVPVSGVSVTLSAGETATRFLPSPTQVTDSDGRAIFSLEAPPNAAVIQLRISAPEAAPVFASLEVRPGPATVLKAELVPQAFQIAEMASVEIIALDRFDNRVDLSSADITVQGVAAALVGDRQVQGIELGEGTVSVRAGELSTSAGYVVYGRVWRHELATTPLKLHARENGEFVLLTNDAVEVRDQAGELRLSVQLPGTPADLEIDDGAGRAFVSLVDYGNVDNIVVVDLASGARETWSTGMNRAASLTFDPVTQTLVAVDGGHTVCIMPMATRQCDLREVGSLPVTAGIDPASGTVLVSNHTSFDATLLFLDGRSVTIPAGQNPFGVGVDTQRHIGVVANSMGPDVTLVDMAGGTSLGNVETGHRPMEMVIDSDKGLAVIDHANGTVAWLDLTTRQVTGRLSFDHDLRDISADLRQRVVFIVPPFQDRLLLSGFDEPRLLPALTPQGQVIEAAAPSAGPFVAVITVFPPGFELHRLPIPDTDAP